MAHCQSGSGGAVLHCRSHCTPKRSGCGSNRRHVGTQRSGSMTTGTRDSAAGELESDRCADWTLRTQARCARSNEQQHSAAAVNLITRPLVLDEGLNSPQHALTLLCCARGQATSESSPADRSAAYCILVKHVFRSLTTTRAHERRGTPAMASAEEHQVKGSITRTCAGAAAASSVSTCETRPSKKSTMAAASQRLSHCAQAGGCCILPTGVRCAGRAAVCGCELIDGARRPDVDVTTS